MGEKKLVDKAIRPMTSLTNLTPAMVTGGQNVGLLGSLPIGYYKGSAAFWDLNLAVNEPNVQAEWQHILGILDGREEDYDLQTVSLAALAATGTTATGTLTVPTGEVWYVSTVELFSPALGAGCQVGANWYCSMWTDRVGSLGHGQPYHAAEQLSGLNAAQTVTDDFWYTAPILGVGNKATMLRLPAGTVLTATFAVRTLAAVNTIACTMIVRGSIGKPLVA